MIIFVIQRYIAPRWFGPSREQKQLEEINQSLAGLQKNIIQMIESLQGIQNTVNKQSSSSSSHGVKYHSHGEHKSSEILSLCRLHFVFSTSHYRLNIHN